MLKIPVTCVISQDYPILLLIKPLEDNTESSCSNNLEVPGTYSREKSLMKGTN